jgi:uncharacterized membrane protein
MRFNSFMNGGNMLGGMWFFWICIIAVIVMVFYFINSGRKIRRETPLSVLKKRYARAEITKVEFEKLRNDLT